MILKMKVLHINSNYLTSKLHENLIDRLENNGIQNTIYMPIKKETKKNFLYESKHDVYAPITFRDIDKFFFTYKQNKIYNKLHHFIEVYQYELVHAHTLFTDGNIAYRIHKEYGVPYIVTVRGFTDIDSFFKKRINLRKRGQEILKHAAQIIFLSETNRQQLLDRYIRNEEFQNEILNKSLIIPNGIDEQYFINKGKQKSLDLSQPIKFIQVGQVRKRKNGLGSVRGIKAFSKKTGIKAELLFVGKIVEKNYAKQIIKEGKGFVSYHPPVDIEELIKIYRKNDIFIMPSFSETFGLVYPEAMSQGLPVLYSKGQGFDGQYKKGHVGYPVLAKNPENIAENIERLIKDYETLSKNAIEAAEKFDWDILSNQYLKLYFELTTAREARSED